MMGSWTTFFALLITGAINFYPKHEFLWERPAVDAGAVGRVVGRRIAVQVGENSYEQERYFGKSLAFRFGKKDVMTFFQP